MGIPTTYAETVAERVSQAIEVAGQSQKSIALVTGIPRTTLARRLSGASPFTVAELAAIALALEVDVSTFTSAGAA